MSQKRPLDAVAPEQDEAPPSPTKRLRRRRRRARAVSLKQMTRMVRQVQFDTAKLCMHLMVLVARLSTVERLLLDITNALQRMLAEQFGALRRSFMGSIEEKIRSALHIEMQGQGRQAASLANDVHEPSRHITAGFPNTGGISRVVKLRFVDADRPKDPLYTGCPVLWQCGKKAKVAIFENGRQITKGNLSKLQIEILAVHADFFTERGHEDFTKNEFNKQIYTYKGKESVLTTINLTGGEAYLGSFFFTESSYRKKLRLTARVKRQDLVFRVQEAITDPFVVKDRRSSAEEYANIGDMNHTILLLTHPNFFVYLANEKSYPPSKEEAVHRLEKISLKLKCCNDLAGENITTVKHLMRRYNKDKSGLQKLTGMKKENWSTMIQHAATSDPGNEIYSYRVKEENYELLFNDFYDLVGTMIDGFYVPYSVNGVDQILQNKVNNWKMSAHKKFEDLENSVGLLPDYFMSNGLPVRAVLLNSDASTSIQAGTTWQCFNEITAQQEFGERQQLLQENGFSPVQVFSNKDVGPSKQETLPLPHYTYAHTMHQELCQLDPSMPSNEMPHSLTHRNIFGSQASFSVHSHNFAPAQDDSSVTGLGLTAQYNGYLRCSTTDALDTSYPVIGGSVRTSSLNHVQTDTLSGLSSIEELLEQVHVAGQGFVPANDAELPSYCQFDDYDC